MKKCITSAAFCLQLATLCLLTVCICIPCLHDIASAADEEPLPPGKVPEDLRWPLSDGGAMDQEEFSGVTIHSVFHGSKTEPKVVMFYPGIGHDKIDKAMQDMTNTSIDQFYSYVEKEKAEVVLLVEDFSKFIVSSNYRVTFPTSKTVAITFYTGWQQGARASRYTINCVYSLETGKRLEFKDLFEKPQVAFKLLTEWSRAMLQKTVPGISKKELLDTEINEYSYTNFRVAPNGFYIPFHPNLTGPVMVQAPEIFIPLKKFESAGPSPAIWDKPDLRKIALSTPLKTPIPYDSEVRKEHATFLIPLDDVVTLPCREGDYYNERCMFIAPDFTLHTDANSQEFAFVEGPFSYGGVAVVGYLWGIYATEEGYKSTNFIRIGDRYDYKSVSMKGNTILFKGVKTSHYGPERTDLKFSIINGVLKKVN